MSRMTSPARLAAVAVALSLSAAAVARGQQTYDLKLRAPADAVASYDTTFTTGSQVQQGGQAHQSDGTRKRAGKVTILALKDGTPSAIQVDFSPDCAQTMTTDGQAQTTPFPLAGKAVRVSKDELGIVKIDGAATDPDTTNEVTGMLTPDRSIYPSHPVAVGDEWDGDAASLGKAFNFGPGDPLTVKCKFVRVGSVDGRPTADLTVTVAGQKVGNGVTGKLALSGTTSVDLASGEELKSEMTGTLDLSGQSDTPQGAVAVSGQVKLDVRGTVHVVSGFPAPVAAATPAAAYPVPPAAPAGVNPLDPTAAPPADKFVGTFKSDKLTMQMDAAAAGGYAGTITMGGHRYPVTAKANGDKLVGSFESGGTKFDFTATVDGANLQLTTGMSKYALKKDAPANPLDPAGGGAAGNPLAP